MDQSIKLEDVVPRIVLSNIVFARPVGSWIGGLDPESAHAKGEIESPVSNPSLETIFLSALTHRSGDIFGLDDEGAVELRRGFLAEVGVFASSPHDVVRP